MSFIGFTHILVGTYAECNTLPVSNRKIPAPLTTDSTSLVVDLILVHISGHLKDYTGKKRDFEIPDSINDVTRLIEKLNLMFPGIKDRIFDDQDIIRPFVNIFVNGENIRELGQEGTKINPGDAVHILPSVAGGSIGFYP